MAAEESGVRQRKQEKYTAPWAKGGPEYDPDLPYGPKVFLARKKKPDAWWVKYLEVSSNVHTLSINLGPF